MDRLREMVLQLAVQGQLVSPDPNDEPADALLERIAADKTAYVREHGLTRLRKVRPVETEEIPHEVPATWRWARMGELANAQAGFAFKSAHFNERGRGERLVRIRDVLPGTTLTFYDGDFRPEFLISTGDYLVGMDGNFNVGRWEGGRALLNQRVTRFRWYSADIVPAWAVIPLQQRLDELHGQKAYTTVQHLSGKQIDNCPIPVPPLAQQHRIVARVDELMALLDRLEAARDAREATRASTRDSALAALQGAETREDVEIAWARVSEAMGDLLREPEDVEAFRQTVLQLAVRGRLVPQNPEDGSGKTLLDQIEAAAASGRKSRTKITYENEYPFDTPQSWEWVYLGLAMGIVNGRAFKPSEWAERDLPIIRIQNLNSPSAPFNHCDFEVKKKYHVSDGDLLLSWSGTPGTSFGAFLWDRGPAVLNQHIFRCTIRGRAFEPAFLCLAINSRLGEMIERAHGGVGLRHVTKGKLEGLWLPLPPLAEQRRIVTAVDRHMALLNRLEEALGAQRSAQAAFAAAAVHDLQA